MIREREYVSFRRLLILMLKHEKYLKKLLKILMKNLCGKKLGIF